MSTKRIACIASVDIINFIPYLLLSSFCIELFICPGKFYSYSDNSSNPCDVFLDPSALLGLHLLCDKLCGCDDEM